MRLWNVIALREAIVNTFVHNDYTHEVPPKFEIYRELYSRYSTFRCHT